ncbi:MFS monocarboxylate transporter [Coccidioides immitis RS]|uniref:MFS monocarboxylate transporter n=2 Tax=Coccidioides immitis TaxID=5501 RepID=A0A0E1RUP0_COCIM|nr:MFS monocarboxylate transporter [Coccidioides immitis RS]EAS28118.2 MFS monocarboxylate transporter [Coccidioides immitis RS]
MSSTFYILFPDNGRPRRNRATNLSFSTHQAFLIRCFIVEAIIWGLPFAYGLFQDFYTTHEPFKSDPSGIAAIGTTALGMMYLGSPICFMAMQKWPFWRTWSIRIGFIIIIAALVTSSFATDVWQLVFTQGALYAVGGTLAYGPAIVFVDEWFVRQKGLAYGVMWAGTGFAGVTVPFLMSWMLGRFHLKPIAWAVIVAILAIPLFFVVKSRTPILGNIFKGLGYFMPTIYLPSYARSLGVRNEAITATVSLLNGAAVFGCIFVGFLIDRFHITTAILISTIEATFSIFVLWGLSSSIAVLCIFSMMYGFFAGGYSYTYAGLIKEVHADENGNGSEPGIVIGFLAAGCGIGSVICGPLSEALIKGRPWMGKAGMGYGTAYGPLIVFAGISALLGGVSFGARLLRWMK